MPTLCLSRAGDRLLANASIRLTGRRFHTGVIFAEVGEPVIAPADGEVAFRGSSWAATTRGSAEHGNGVSTRYGHLSGFAVTAGQHVHRGDVVGMLLSGRSTGPHLTTKFALAIPPVIPTNTCA